MHLTWKRLNMNCIFLPEICGNKFNQKKVHLKFPAKWPLKEQILKIHNKRLTYLLIILLIFSFIKLIDVASDKICFNVKYVTEDFLISLMSKLSNKSTAGDDLFPSFLVKDTRHIIPKQLSIIINFAATFPDAWKRTRVTPGCKKGKIKFAITHQFLFCQNFWACNIRKYI